MRTINDEYIYVDIDIEQESNLDIELFEFETIEIEVEEGSSSSSGSGRLPDYMGAYSVVPRIGEQTLNTKDKSMTKDVTVFAIPYEEVSNLSGGYTATIGLEEGDIIWQ